MAKNMAAIVAHHRKLLEMYPHAPERISLESIQIVLLADILDAVSPTKKKAKKPK